MASFCFCQDVSVADFSLKGRYTAKIFEINDLVDHSRSNRNVPIKVHYPAESGKFPVIVVSHGAGGSWDSHFALAQHLASYGYIVLCLEHVGSNRKALMRNMRIIKNFDAMLHNSNEMLARPRDVSFAIDQLNSWNQSNEFLQGKIDVENVGVLGHSYGAYTSMAIAGIRPALNWIKPTIGKGMGLADDVSDKRVKACVALSPQGAGDPFFAKESFKTLSTPLLGISGTKDKLLGDVEPIERYKAFSLWPESGGKHIFLWLENAAHSDFSDPEGGETRGQKSANRKEVQKIVRTASILFFDYYLKGKGDVNQSITDNSLKAYLSGAVNKLEVRKK